MGIIEVLRKLSQKKEPQVRSGAYKIEYMTDLEDGKHALKCIVGVRKEEWEGSFAVKWKSHMQIEEELIQRGLLDFEKQHPIMADPQEYGENGKQTIFQIILKEGQRPNNVAWLY